MIKRLLRENSKNFQGGDRDIIPITGFSCWALGYLDKGYRLIGCLLHPAQNDGVDLRYRIDYGEKCARELCPEAHYFLELDKVEQTFWLHLADGFDSFSYSSRKSNPLFSLMGWGKRLLGQVCAKEGGRRFSRESFFRAYPFFATACAGGSERAFSSRANAYLITRLVGADNLDILRSRSWVSRFCRFEKDLKAHLGRISGDGSGDSDPYVHLLDIDRDFADYLRLNARIQRIKMADAERLKEIVDEELVCFRDEI